MHEKPNSIHIKKLAEKPTSEDYLNEYLRTTKLDKSRPLIQNIFKYLKNKALLNPEINPEIDAIINKIEKDLKQENLSVEEAVKIINEAAKETEKNFTPPQE
ncbi:MAG: hypothetical protein KBD14_00290 [Candidatus Pacebacteria bacterium]|nr:hypothetical protein [Candidatus Paceibacterota bacterium]